MISNYATLQDSIAGYLHRSDLTAMIPEFIADAEARIADELRIRAMEAAFSSVIATGSVAVPASFLEWQFLYIDGTDTRHMQRKDAEWIYSTYPNRSAAGKPKFFAREGENLIFGPYPDSAYTVKGRYYTKLAALSATNTSNWFITNAPNLLRFAALSEAAPYLLDDGRIATWERKYQAVKHRIERTETRENFSGSQLVISKG